MGQSISLLSTTKNICSPRDCLRDIAICMNKTNQHDSIIRNAFKGQSDRGICKMCQQRDVPSQQSVQFNMIQSHEKKPTSMALVMAIIMAIILAIIHYLQGPDHGVGEDVGVVLAAEVQTIHLLVVPPLQIQNYVLQIHILTY